MMTNTVMEVQGRFRLLNLSYWYRMRGYFEQFCPYLVPDFTLCSCRRPGFFLLLDRARSWGPLAILDGDPKLHNPPQPSVFRALALLLAFLGQTRRVLMVGLGGLLVSCPSARYLIEVDDGLLSERNGPLGPSCQLFIEVNLVICLWGS